MSPNLFLYLLPAWYTNMFTISLGDQWMASECMERAWAQILLKISVWSPVNAALDPAVNTFDVTPFAISSSVLTFKNRVK